VFLAQRSSVTVPLNLSDSQSLTRIPAVTTVVGSSGLDWGTCFFRGVFFTFVHKIADNMSTTALYSKFEALPDKLQQQVLDYIEFLLSRESKNQKPKKSAKQATLETRSPVASNTNKQSEDHKYPISAPKKPLKAGFLKGSFVMAADFDEPLEDFKAYMQ